MSINNVSISGNLTRDPEVRTTSGGSSVTKFTVAVNERRKGASGEWEDYPNFIDCTMFGNRGEAFSRFASKGAKVAVSGKLHQSTWESDGQKRSKVEVICDEWELMQKQQKESGLVYEDDIPF